MLELRAMHAFVCVAEELHFARAARRLNISQPPLTRTIQSLETELGTRLLDRNKRHVRLTEPGRLFLDRARQILTDVDRATSATRALAAGESGSITVGFAGVAALKALPSAVRHFRATHPDVRLELEEMTTVRQVERLRAGALDLGILSGPVGTGCSSLVLEVISREPLRAALPATHVLAGSRRLHLSQLASESFILFPRSAAPGFHDHVLALCRSAAFSPQVIQEATEAQTMVSLVASGMGIALVPASVCSLKRENVSFVPLASPLAYFELVAAHQNPPRPVTTRFLAALRCGDPTNIMIA
jgi:DNA-binding transcriptional LysR family regulator